MYHLGLLKKIVDLMEENSEADLRYKSIICSLSKKSETLFRSLEINFDNKILTLKINEHIIEEIKKLQE